MRSIYLLLLSSLLLCACRSSRSMQKEINPMRADLFYELASPVYEGEAKQIVYLDFIDYSNLDYYTKVKKRGGFAVPLLLFVYETNRFNIHLGEGSLTQPYREFLTEALLTECNTPDFALKPSPVRPIRKNTRRLPREVLGDSLPTSLPDSVLRLKVKILHNETYSGVKLKESSFLWFGGEYVTFPNHRANDANTDLSIVVLLSKGDDCLLDKTYTVHHRQQAPDRGYEDSVQANEICLRTMTGSLSTATKEIVENISKELNLIVAASRKN